MGRFSLCLCLAVFGTVEWAGLPLLSGQEVSPESESGPIAGIEEPKTLQDWLSEIREALSEQDFLSALRICEEAERLYPDQRKLIDFKQAIQNYLNAVHGEVEVRRIKDRPEDQTEIQPEDQTEIQPEDQTEIQPEDQAEKKQESVSFLQLLIQEVPKKTRFQVQLTSGISFVMAGSEFKFHQSSPHLNAMFLYFFTPKLGLSLEYLGVNWEIPLKKHLSSVLQEDVFFSSVALSGRLRGSLFDSLPERGALNLDLELGLGFEDFYPEIKQLGPPSFFLKAGLAVQDNPFYHYLGVDLLAGLYLDANFSIRFYSLSPGEEVTYTQNFGFSLRQSLGSFFWLGAGYQVIAAKNTEPTDLVFHQLSLQFAFKTKFRDL